MNKQRTNGQTKRSYMRRRHAVIAVACLAALASIGIYSLDRAWQNWTSQERSETVVEAARDSQPATPQTPARAAVVPNSQPNWKQRDNPIQDGWRTEQHAQFVTSWLQTLFKTLPSIDAANTGTKEAKASFSTLLQTVAPSFEGNLLIPGNTKTVYSQFGFHVERWQSNTSTTADSYANHDGFVAMLREASQHWRASKLFDVHVKVTRVNELADAKFVTEQLVELHAHVGGQLLTHHLTLRTEWQQVRPDQVKLSSGELTHWESSRTTTPAFRDSSAALLGNNDVYAKQLLLGVSHWLDRSQDLRYFSPLGTPGVAVADVNGDGRDDIYLCQEASLPNLLFLQQPDGTVRESGAEWNVNWLESTRSALLVDFDNDGDQDLAIAVLGAVIIAENTGSEFRERLVLPTDDDTTSLCASDYDLDGDCDIYVCVDYPNDYFSSGDETTDYSILGGGGNRVYHDSNSAGANALFRNDIERNEWQFKNVTGAVGLDSNNKRFSWAASWEDYDHDGDPDLLVANDFGRNNLYRNDDGTFQDVAAETKSEDSASGMSTAWSDVDRDGDMDIYIANMFSSAGQRVTTQDRFKPEAEPDVRARLQRFAKGSTLLSNQDGQRFADVSIPAGVTLGRWAWSSVFADINNDGWQDILVANGYITANDTSDL